MCAVPASGGAVNTRQLAALLLAIMPPNVAACYLWRYIRENERRVNVERWAQRYWHNAPRPDVWVN